jgi:ABC-type transport system involved in cytochrome bd biosynthesis fused ATPase/permease subunit
MFAIVTHPLHVIGGSSRTFMKFNSGTVRFVAVDEPTSALDADGELQLFNNLLAARKGKTMVFVTHRFGHLTKHADKIV